jgi:hypothetical protein
MPETFEVGVDWKVKELGPVFREAVNQMAKTVRDRARQDVAGGLHNSGRFVRGTNVKVDKIEGGYSVDVIQRPSFAKVWEFGGVSRGNPYLWLPAPGNRALKRNYKGKLIRPKGRRILVAAVPGTKVTGMAGTGTTQRGDIKYVGISSITNRKRFHLSQIATEEANKFITTWTALFKA